MFLNCLQINTGYHNRVWRIYSNIWIYWSRIYIQTWPQVVFFCFKEVTWEPESMTEPILTLSSRWRIGVGLLWRPRWPWNDPISALSACPGLFQAIMRIFKIMGMFAICTGSLWQDDARYVTAIWFRLRTLAIILQPVCSHLSFLSRSVTQLYWPTIPDVVSCIPRYDICEIIWMWRDACRGKILTAGSQGRQASGIQKESTVVGKGNTSGGKHSNSGFSREEALWIKQERNQGWQLPTIINHHILVNIFLCTWDWEYHVIISVWYYLVL